MAERTEKIRLIAEISNYVAGMEQAAAKTRELGSAGEKLAQTRQAYTALGQAAVAVGVLAAAGVALAVARYAEFDSAISSVKAATQETAANMNLLRDAALEAGGETVFTATEAANAIEELGKAGLSTQQILEGGLDGALSLAAAGQLEVADAASIAAIAVKQFGLEGGDIPHVADLLAAGAGKAVGDVSDLSAALNQAGLVANSTGLSIEDTTGVLAAFADSGLLGSDAGTSLKTALQRLTPSSKEAAAEIERLGVSAFDTNGEFIGISAVAGKYQDALSGVSTESRNASLQVIFGADAVRAANVLYTQGADGIERYIDQTNDSGYAAQVAADRLDNLSGDVEKLGGAFDTALIKTGSSANDSLRSLVQTATFLVDAIGDIPGPALGVAVAFGVVVAAMGLVGGGALTLVPKIAELKVGLAALEISGKGAALAVGGVTVALTAAVVVLGLIVQRQVEAAQKADAYADTLEKGTQRITKSTREMAKESLSANEKLLGIFDLGADSAYDNAERLGISLDTVTDAATGNVAALKQLQAQQEEIADSDTDALIAKYGDEYVLAEARINSVVDAVKGENDSIQSAIDLAQQKEDADRQSAAGSRTAKDAYLEAADGADQLASSVNELIDAIMKANGIGQDAVSANSDYQAALDGVEEQIKNVTTGVEGFGLGISDATAEGRSNLDMLNDLAQKSQDAATAQFELDGNTQNYSASLATGRQNLIDSAVAMGASSEEAQILADKIYSIPTQKEIDILADTLAASTSVEALLTKINRLPKKVTVDIVLGGTAGAKALGFVPGDYATGGYTGLGGKYEPAGIVHRKEFVSTAETTANPSNRAALEYMHAGGVIKGYADGGYVNSSQFASSGPSSFSVAPVVSLKGATLLMSVDGRQMTAVISDQIVSYDREQRSASAAGSRGF